MKIKFSLFIIIIIALSFFVSLPAYSSEKKGIGISKFDDRCDDKIKLLNVAWYYNWDLSPRAFGFKDKFVPMFWGHADRYAAELDRLKAMGKPKALLVFNEPDHHNQSDLSVSYVLSKWPELADKAMTISSPTPANALGNWMREFMDRSKSLQLKVDFVAVHWYGMPDSTKFLKFLNHVYETYKKPIWITEFAIADWKAKDGRANRFSETSALTFMREVLPQLEALPYIHRYAWFGASDNKKEFTRTSRLFRDDGSLSELGKHYSKQ